MVVRGVAQPAARTLIGVGPRDPLGIALGVKADIGGVGGPIGRGGRRGGRSAPGGAADRARHSALRRGVWRPDGEGKRRRPGGLAATALTRVFCDAPTAAFHTGTGYPVGPSVLVATARALVG